jgi:hypothetical protein
MNFSLKVTTSVAIAVLLSGLCCAGAALAASPSTFKTTSCPPGSQINPSNSQQCISLSPSGPETAATSCTTAGYSLQGSDPNTCRNTSGKDTFGNRR